MQIQVLTSKGTDAEDSIVITKLSSFEADLASICSKQFHRGLQNNPKVWHQVADDAQKLSQ